MSNLKVQASPTGTGVVTLVPPTTNTDRTVTLPDQTGTVYITGGDIGTPSAGNGSNLTNLNASNLGSGTVPDARFPATLPAVSGANLTNLNASNLASGTVPTARLASGTANNTTFLRGDSTWQTISTTPTTADVLNATAGAATGALGSYALLFQGGSSLSPGATLAGSSLFYSSCEGQQNGQPNGTWRLMGMNGATASRQTTSVWLRIS